VHLKYFDEVANMKIKQTEINLLRAQFAAIQSKEDLVKILTKAKKLLYGEKATKIHLKSLTYYANPAICKSRYTPFHVKKKSGDNRVIHAPVRGLRIVLSSLNFLLQCLHEPHKTATGFVPGKSIVDNARIHTNSNYVYNIDLKDFFHSFNRNKVKMAFMYQPFGLKKSQEPLAFLLASLCTHPIEIDGKTQMILPQGSPTSPTLSNILCIKLDRRLNGLAKRFGAKYTRYADDITFSSSDNIYTQADFQAELQRIIVDDQKLTINAQKTRLQTKYERQQVTGLVVNDKNVNVHRAYVKQIRMWLYYWETYGKIKAERLFQQDYQKSAVNAQKKAPPLQRILEGKLNFLKMVKGKKNNTYRRLKQRFDELASVAGNNDTKPKKPKRKSSKPLPRPQETKGFLSLFNNSKGLKYLTHKFNDITPPDYTEFMALCKEEFDQGQKKYPNVPTALLERIQQYTFASAPEWFTRKGEEKNYHHMGWSEPKFVEWYQKSSLHPASNAKWNQEMILPFKHTIEVRAGYLPAIIDEAITLALGDSRSSFDIQISNDTIKVAEFYTDVDRFQLALYHIFSTIKTHGEANFCYGLTIDFIKEKSGSTHIKKLIITHVDSEATKPANDEGFIKGDLNTIKTLLWGLCNYNIEAKFPDGFQSKTILADKQNLGKSSEEEEKHIKGFTHILKFY